MEIPKIGLGTWNLRGIECEKVVENAIKIGYRHIDTAQMYINEKEVGNGIKNSGIDRSKLFVTTKFCLRKLAPNVELLPQEKNPDEYIVRYIPPQQSSLFE